jgi:hypothetical protein
MKNLLEIKKELTATINRTFELITMRDTAGGNLQTIQQDFVGKRATLDQLQAEQGKLTALNASIEVLEAKQSELKTELESAQKAESRQTAIEQMKKLANESETAFNSYLALRAQTDAIFAESAQKLVNKSLAWREKQSQFKVIARESGLTESEIKAVPNFDSATITTYTVPELDYGVAVSATESILNSKLTKAIQAKEQSEFNERRFKRIAELPTVRMSETENVLEYVQTA